MTPSQMPEKGSESNETQFREISYPMNLSITFKSKNTIKLTWKKVDGVKEYTIYRSKTGKKDSYQKLVSTSKTTYLDKKSQVGNKPYYY